MYIFPQLVGVNYIRMEPMNAYFVKKKERMLKFSRVVNSVY
jgi:hypothetical protein